MNKWTQFWDMHSGGGRKLKWEEIYIEAPKEAACRIFEEFFGRDPYNVTCDCCGEDYAIYDYNSFDEAVNYSLRGLTVEEYAKGKSIKVLSRADLPKNFLQHEGDLI